MDKKKHQPRPKYGNNGGPPAPDPASRPCSRVSEQLAYTAAAAAAGAFVGGVLAKQDWQPKTIANALVAVGTAVECIARLAGVGAQVGTNKATDRAACRGPRQRARPSGRAGCRCPRQARPAC